MALFLSLGTTNAYAVPGRDETVYVMLNNDGSVSHIKVVNHIYGINGTDTYTDYGMYTDVKSLTAGIAPKIDGSRIIWPADNLNGRDLYYEGTVDRELPVSINIKYYLDGKLMDADKLSGKSGHVKVDIAVKYNETGKKYSLMAQIQAALDLDVFSNIKGDGSKVVVGRVATVAFVAFPPDDQTFTLEMDGRDIYMDPINISLLKAGYIIPDSIKESMGSLADGLEDMGDAASGLEKGMGDVIEGTISLKSGIETLSGSIGKIHDGSSSIISQTSKISWGMQEFKKGLAMMADMDIESPEGGSLMMSGLQSLASESGNIQNGLEGVKDGSTQLEKGYKDVEDGLKELQYRHDKLVQAAKLLLQSSDPKVLAIAQGIIDEAAALEQISKGLSQCNDGLESLRQNVQSLSDGHGRFDGGLKNAVDNMEKMAGGSSQFTDAMTEMYNKFGELEYGVNQVFHGFAGIDGALGAVHENTKDLPAKIGILVDGQQQVNKGIHSLKVSGINVMKSKIEEGLNNSILGRGTRSYTSFVDNDNNKNSTVQFVMRTPGIKKMEIKKESPINSEENKTFLQRILDLFR